MKHALEIKVDQQEDFVEVTLSGTVDTDSADKLKSTVYALCDGQQPRILVDFSGLSYINSMCMGLLASFSKRCKANGGAFAVFGVEDRILTVMKLIHLDEIVSILKTRDEAVRALDP